MNIEQVIEESRPMLLEFLFDIGFASEDRNASFTNDLDKFSEWISRQKIEEGDKAYLRVRVAAFIGEYLIETKGAKWNIRDGRIMLGTHFNDGIVREFEPHLISQYVVEKQISLKETINKLMA